MLCQCLAPFFFVFSSGLGNSLEKYVAQMYCAGFEQRCVQVSCAFEWGDDPEIPLRCEKRCVTFLMPPTHAIKWDLPPNVHKCWCTDACFCLFLDLSLLTLRGRFHLTTPGFPNTCTFKKWHILYSQGRGNCDFDKHYRRRVSEHSDVTKTKLSPNTPLYDGSGCLNRLFLSVNGSLSLFGHSTLWRLRVPEHMLFINERFAVVLWPFHFMTAPGAWTYGFYQWTVRCRSLAIPLYDGSGCLNIWFLSTNGGRS